MTGSAVGHIYKTDDPDELTLLTYRPYANSDAWFEIWVKEGDLNEREDLVCFKSDGTQIVISPRREVFVYERETRKWKNPGHWHKAATYRQKTVYVRKRVGVDASFKSIDRRRIET